MPAAAAKTATIEAIFICLTPSSFEDYRELFLGLAVREHTLKYGKVNPEMVMAHEIASVTDDVSVLAGNVYEIDAMQGEILGLSTLKVGYG